MRRMGGHEFDISERLKAMPRAELERLLQAGQEVRNCIRVLSKVKANIVGEVLKNQGTFYEWTHFPKGDVIDWETNSQYYYHAHPKSERPDEHGHFHTFLRYEGMDETAAPAPLRFPQADAADRVGAHLIAISMSKKGLPIKLFTTNRWVTDETWYHARDVARMVDCFAIDHAHPSWPTNIWISSMLVLFRPQIDVLLAQRDRIINDAWARDDGHDVFEERSLNVLSEMSIDISAQVAAVADALSGKSP